MEKVVKTAVPPEVRLGNLKSLWLMNWVLVGDSMNRLISSCRVLELLCLDGCGVANASEVDIQSPSLKELSGLVSIMW